MKPLNIAVAAAALLAASLALTGCDQPQQDRTASNPGSQNSVTQAVQSAASNGNDTQDELQGEALSRFNDAKLYCLGIMLYAVKNQNRCPTNLDQTMPYLREANSPPSGTNRFDLLYQGSMAQFTNSTTTGGIIVIRSEPWQGKNGKWTRIYGFADGHCEAHSEPGGNFDAWEKQHSAKTGTESR
jgi:hypothetical protein